MGWFRSWDGAPTDPKWRVIAARAGVPHIMVPGIAWALLDHASQAEDRGSVAGFDFETYAVDFGVDEAQVRAVFAAMEAKGMIVSGRLANWEKRQPNRETYDEAPSTARVRRYRERQKSEPTLPLDPAPQPRAKEASAPAEASNAPAAETASAPAQVSEQAAHRAPDRVMISAEAHHLADEIRSALGYSDPQAAPVSWHGDALRVQSWLDQGWQPLVIIDSVRAQVKRRGSRGPPNTIKFFEPGIAEAHAQVSASVPVATVIEPEVIHAKARTGGGLGRLARELLGDDEPGAFDTGRAPGTGALRVIDGSRHS